MKKLIFVTLLLSFSLLFAQEETSSVYKQEAGDFNLELSVNPGSIFGSGSGSTFSFINNSIKFRKFSTGFKAFRLGVGLNFNSDVDIIQEADPDLDRLELKEYITTYTVSVMPGFEKHFEGTNRFSPYTGMQFLLSYSHTTLKNEIQFDDEVYTETFTNSPAGAGAAGLSVGLGVVAGFDYYITPKIYLGAELGIGLEYMKMLESSYVNSYDHDLDTTQKHGYSINLSPGLSTSGIRLGWVF